MDYTGIMMLIAGLAMLVIGGAVAETHLKTGAWTVFFGACLFLTPITVALTKL